MQLPPSPSSSPLPVLGPQTALFLDFDGTLADLAPQPDAVQVDAGLIPTLAALAGRLGGALAIVSGRQFSDLDRFLAPLRLPCAAEHGAQRRLGSGEVVSLASPDLGAVVQATRALAEQHPGLRVEVKSAAVALHYRHAPALETLCLQVMTALSHRTPGVELLRGKCVFEIKPSGISKGTAIEAFMAEPPFAGRVPIFAGDDLTDEAGFSVVQFMGGEGVKVGEGHTLADYRCPTPFELRRWLHAASRSWSRAPRGHSSGTEPAEHQATEGTGP